MTQTDVYRLETALLHGDIAVVRTDTLYGLIARADDKRAVEKVYAAKGRSPKKACIVLLASPNDAPSYHDIIAHYSDDAASPTTVIVPSSAEPAWICREENSVAYRVVHDPLLKRVIQAVGPVIAPSANPEGSLPARSIDEARAYFKDQVKVYLDGGVVPEDIQASRIIKYHKDGSITEVRA